MKEMPLSSPPAQFTDEKTEKFSFPWITVVKPGLILSSLTQSPCF